MKAILGFLAFVAIVIFLIVIIVRGGRNDNRTDSSRPELVSAAASDSVFTFTEAGPIVADEEFYQIRVNVSRADRSVQVYRGYQETLVASEHFNNNQEAFEQFLAALERAGYTRERGTRLDSEAGVCASGRRFTFVSDQFGEDFFRWTTSCKEKGNLGGSFSGLQRLFTRQIPEYRQFISDTRRETGLAL